MNILRNFAKFVLLVFREKIVLPESPDLGGGGGGALNHLPFLFCKFCKSVYFDENFVCLLSIPSLKLF